MKKYICKKRATYCGTTYFAEQEIPADHIDPNRVKTLAQYGYIAVVDAPDPVEPPAEPPVTPPTTQQPTDTNAAPAGDEQPNDEETKVDEQPTQKAAGRVKK